MDYLRTSSLKQAFVSYLCLSILTAPAMAQTASEPVAYDLGSSELKHDAPATANLTIGDGEREILAGSKVTAAMFFAIQQAVNGSGQSLVLNLDGIATGGSVAIGQVSGSLTIPVNVTAMNDAAAGQINVAGTLINFGAIQNFTSLPVTGTLATAVISAGNIINQPGAFIGTVVPSSFTENATAAVNLVLSTPGFLTNYGTITGLADVSILAGGPVTNAASATVQAASNVNILSSIGQIVNTGSILAGTNVNLATSTGNTLFLSNLEGTIRAQGVINVVGDKGVAIRGGMLDCDLLNILSATGPAAGLVHEITGMVDVTANACSLAVEAGELRIGKICVDGDPTFYNTAGGVQISSALVFPGQPLAIVASTDITTAAGAGAINTGSSTANGAGIVMVAGADFTASGGPVSTDPFAPVTLTITGASASGGSIILDGANPITSLNTASTKTNGSGGEINLNAFAGAVPGSGRVVLPQNVTLTSGGSGTGANGRVRVVGGTPSGTAVITGGINTTGGAAGTGPIAVAAVQPTLIAGGATIVNGVLSNPSGLQADINLAREASLYTGTLRTTGAGINLISRSNVLVSGSVIADGGTTSAGAFIRIWSAPSTPFIVGASATISGVTGSISSKGGSTSGNGGTIAISSAGSGGLIIESPALLNVSPVVGNGGVIGLETRISNGAGLNVNGTGPLLIGSGTLSASAKSSNLAGGQILISYSRANTFAVTGPGPLILSANGSGGGNGGMVTIQGIGANGIANNTDITVGSGAGHVQAYATGGSAGSATGNGGRVNLEAGRHLTIDPTFMNANPLGNNGVGGTYRLVAGVPFFFQGSNGGPGQLTITGSLNADGKGTGGGGLIRLGITDPGAFTIGASAGCINCVAGSVTARAGSSGNAGNLFIESFGDLVLSSGANVLANATNGHGGVISFNLGGGTISVGGGTISASASGAGNFNGGLVQLWAAYLDTGTGLTLTANGTGSGNAGSVSILAPGSNLVVDGASSSILSISATGGSAGSSAGNAGEVVISSRSLQVNPLALNVQAMGTNGNGAKYEFYAVEGLSISGDLNANGKGNGNGGRIIISTTFPDGPDSNRLQQIIYGKTGVSSTAAFEIGQMQPCLNCVSGKLLANAGLGGAAGGTITLTNTKDLIISDLTSLQTAATKGVGGTITITVNDGNLVVGAGTIDTSAKGGTFKGGTIALSALDLVVQGGGLLTLLANGSGGGDGGTISVITKASTSNITTGTQLVANAKGGTAGSSSGNGGAITVSAGGNLIVSPAHLSAGPLGINGNGASYKLTAGAMLTLTSSLLANGIGSGVGGAITLASNTATPFEIGGATGCTGCVAGSLQASGTSGAGSISVSNPGGIIVNSFADLQLLTGAAGGVLTLTAANGTVSLPGGLHSVSANAASSANGGIINLTGAQFLVRDGGQLTLRADAAGTGNGGGITLVSTSTKQDVQVSGKAFSLSAAGGSASSLSGNGGSITVQSGRDLLIDPAFLVAGPSGKNGNGATITAIAGRNLLVNGSLNASGKGTGAGGVITLVTGSNTFAVGVSNTSAVTGGLIATAGTPAGTGGKINILGPAGGLFNVNIVSEINAGTSGTIMVSSSGPQPLSFLNVSGFGKIEGKFGASANSLAVQFAQSSQTTLGTITALNGSLVLAVPSMLIPNGSIVSSNNGNIAINSSKIVNNGIIRANTTGSTITIFNNSGVTVTGAGVIAATNVVFSSSAGSVNVLQGGIVGSVSGSAAGGFSVGQSILSTSGGQRTDFISAQAVNNNTLTASIQQPIQIAVGVQSEMRGRRTFETADNTGGGGDDSVSGDVVYVSHANQALTGFVASSDTLIFADEDTMASKEDFVILHKGKVVIDTGESEQIIGNNVGKVKVKPNSTVIIESRVPGHLRAVALTGRAEVEVQGRVVDLESGSEVLAGDELSEDEMVPADGIPRGEVLHAGITVGTAVSRKIALRGVIQRDVMIAGSLVHIEAAQGRLHSRYSQRVKLAADSQHSFKDVLPPTVHRLATRSSDAQPLQPSPARTPAKGPSSFKMTADTDANFRISMAGRLIGLKRGGLVFSAPDAITLNTPMATLKATKSTCLSVD
jgi:hypothetical protein